MIETVTKADLKQIEKIMESIKEEMRQEGNPQWGSTDDDYPSRKKILDDINKKKMMKYVEDHEIKGIISMAKDTAREYDGLLDNSREAAYVIHRLAIPIEYRKQHIATKLIKHVEVCAINNQVRVLKSSTEVSNTKMNNLFVRSGFTYKGKYSYNDYPGIYNYYEKEL